MGDWLEYIRTFWPIGVAVSGLIAGILVLWLKSGFAPRESVTKLEVTTSRHEDRIAHLEKGSDSAPTRHDLQEDISNLRVLVAGLVATTDGLKGSLKSIDSKMSLIIDKGMPSR